MIETTAHIFTVYTQEHQGYHCNERSDNSNKKYYGWGGTSGIKIANEVDFCSCFMSKWHFMQKQSLWRVLLNMVMHVFSTAKKPNSWSLTRLSTECYLLIFHGWNITDNNGKFGFLEILSKYKCRIFVVQITATNWSSRFVLTSSDVTLSQYM